MKPVLGYLYDENDKKSLEGVYAGYPFGQFVYVVQLHETISGKIKKVFPKTWLTLISFAKLSEKACNPTTWLADPYIGAFDTIKLYPPLEKKDINKLESMPLSPHPLTFIPYNEEEYRKKYDPRWTVKHRLQIVNLH